MALDGLVLRGLTHEFNNNLIGCKVDKVYQPEDNDIIINLRGKNTPLNLLISVNSTYPRIHLTHFKSNNPPSPPMFCMFLRKHLVGGIIKKIKQINLDRIVMIEFEAKSELRTSTVKRLYIEIMGKHSNIVLTDENNTILECMKRIGFNLSSKRQVFPGLKYHVPIFDRKLNLLQLSFDMLSKTVKEFPAGKKAANTLVSTFYGFSPPISREICYRSDIDPSDAFGSLNENKVENLIHSLMLIQSKLLADDYQPSVYRDKSTAEYLDFHCFEMRYLINATRVDYETLNLLLDEYYVEKSKFISFQQKTSTLRKKTSTLIDKHKKKLGLLEFELTQAQARDQYQKMGDLILLNIHHIKPKDSEIVVFDYESEKNIAISLDPSLTPSQNAQKFYKKYNKLKTAEKYLLNQLKETKRNLSYLDSVLYALDKADDSFIIDEVKEELYRTGFIKKSSSKKTSPKSKVMKVLSEDGFEILIGKNNVQNDYITFKVASKNDIWFHAKAVPGSHVIVLSKNQDIPDTTIEEAASYAAYFSNSRSSEKAEVDYTFRQHLKKPKGSKPGFVVFTENYSLTITPRKPHSKKLLLD